mmetsp:Transcript_15561/g.31233  ORF Transcript_15561/g.31233 Transcript_15561/m.31233 type:complete len:200 (-) Transcript_15561:416-1015(-)
MDDCHARQAAESKELPIRDICLRRGCSLAARARAQRPRDMRELEVTSSTRRLRLPLTISASLSAPSSLSSFDPRLSSVSLHASACRSVLRAMTQSGSTSWILLHLRRSTISADDGPARHSSSQRRYIPKSLSPDFERSRSTSELFILSMRAKCCAGSSIIVLVSGRLTSRACRVSFSRSTVASATRLSVVSSQFARWRR